MVSEPWQAAEFDLLEQALDVGTPILGVCLGSQLLARAAGGAIDPIDKPEVARFSDIGLRGDAGDDLLLDALPRPFFGFEWHYYGFTPPPGATVLAANAASPQGFRVQNRAWGLQFHIEVDAPTLGVWADVAADVVEEYSGRARYDKSVETFIEQSTTAARAERFAVVTAVTAGTLPPGALDALDTRSDPIADAAAAGVPPDVVDAMRRMRDEQRF